MQILLRIIIIFLVLNISSALSATLENCKWNNKSEIPCLTIKIPNSNKISNKITPISIITRQQIEDNNLIDLPKVLNFVNGVQFSQSGPTGQQTSVFMRGSNSNHTLVLLNGIPINDQSTTNGAYDFGQNFLSNISQIEIYKGTAGAHFGADAIGGAINLVTNIDFQNKISMFGKNNSKSIEGNYTNVIDDWQINLRSGFHKSKTESVLYGGTDQDGAENKSWGINIVKWFSDHLKFRTNIFSRNTFADLDGHSLAGQEGYDANNAMYAFQTGLDYDIKNSKNYITLHTHGYERNYSSPLDELDEYNSDSYVVRAEHSKTMTEKFSYGLGLEHKYDDANFSNRGTYNSSLSGNYKNTGLFTNFGYQLTNGISTSLNIRTDNNNVVGSNNSYKFGIFHENFLPNLNVSLNHSTGFKNPSLYELYGADSYGYKGNRDLSSEKSELNEFNIDYIIKSNSMLSFSLFKNDISDLIEYSSSTYINNKSAKLKQSGIEIAYSLLNKNNEITIYGYNASSEKANGAAQLRRPELSAGINYNKIFNKNFKLISNYKFIGEHFDVHNSNFSTIIMPEVHLLDMGVTKKYYNVDLGIQINNLLNEEYEAPHGFSQNGRNLNFVLKRSF